MLTVSVSSSCLFLDIDCYHNTGWHGHDFAVNRRVTDGTTSYLERRKSGWNWQIASEVKFRAHQNKLMLAILRQALTLPEGEAPLRFVEFKWADNFQNEDSIDEFILNGDAAPNGRFNYCYQVARATDVMRS